MRHVERIAAEPHPVASPAHARVRAYLEGELRALGLTPRVQETLGPFPVGPKFLNIAARLPGRDNTRALMLCAHYDSVPTSPGAGDDAAAVAALLETARALRAGPPLRNDVILLMTDGEELGPRGLALRGAVGFVNDHAWAEDVGLVLNFEARGNAGSSFMFQTSRPNDWLIRAFGRAVRRPAASSIMGDIYEKMPNDTDLTVFRLADMPGMNFAFIGGPMAYHTGRDTPEALSRRSLQHHGDQMLALAGYLGERDLTTGGRDNVVYFDFLQLFLVVQPTAYVWPLTVLAIVAYLWTLRRLRPTLRDALRATGGALLLLVVPCGFAFGQSEWILSRDDIVRHPRMGATDADTWFFLAEVMVALAVAAWLARRAGPERTSPGMGAFWLLALLGTSAAMQGGTFLFLWPLLFGLAAVHLREKPIAAALCLVPAVLLVTPLIHTFHLAMPRSPAAVGLVAMMFGLCAPAFARARFLAPAAAVAAVVLVLV